MKIVLILLVTLTSFLANGCTYRCTEPTNEANRIVPTEVSSETAIAIAKGYLHLDYPLRQYSITVSETSDKWEINFVSTVEPDKGYGPKVTLRKTDGELIYIVNSK